MKSLPWVIVSVVHTRNLYEAPTECFMSSFKGMSFGVKEGMLDVSSSIVMVCV